MSWAESVRWITLGEIGSLEDALFSDGDWVESKDQDPSGEIRLTQLADIGDGSFRDRSNRWLNPEQAQRLGVTYLQNDDILIARMPDPLGRCCLYRNLGYPAITVVDVAILRLARELPRWVMYSINSPQVRNQIAALASGTTRKRISRKNLSSISIPIPPIHIQVCIVAEIDTHLSRLDETVATLQAIQAKLKQARASILKAAVEGRLVETEAELAQQEGANYEDADALLIRSVAEKSRLFQESQSQAARRKIWKEPTRPGYMDKSSIPEGWAIASMDQIADISGGLAKDSKITLGESLPYLRVANVQRGKLELEHVKTIICPSEKVASLLLEKGDVLLNEGGDRDKLGRGWVWNGEISRCIHQNHIFKARIALPEIQPKYISHFCNTIGETYFQNEGKQTTNLASISLSKVRALPIALPPAQEQVRILAEIDRRFSVLDQVESTVKASLARCALLRQAILKRAFEGKLVPAPPEPTAPPSKPEESP